MDGTRQREGGTKQGPWGPRGHPALLGWHISVWEAGPGLDAGEEQGASHRPSAPPRPVPSSSQLSAPRGGAVRTIPFSLSPLAPVRFEQQYPQWGLQGAHPCLLHCGLIPALQSQRQRSPSDLPISGPLNLWSSKLPCKPRKVGLGSAESKGPEDSKLHLLFALELCQVQLVPGSPSHTTTDG